MVAETKLHTGCSKHGLYEICGHTDATCPDKPIGIVDSVKKELPEINPNLQKEEFSKDWKKQFGDFCNPEYGKTHYYQAPKTSINAEHSSRGWKLHVQFEKGWEEKFAWLLNAYGQYFKIEGANGTYFNAKTDSGATIYVGSRQNLEKLLALIEEKADQLTSPRYYTSTISGKHVYAGSGSDEPLGRGLAARFDVQKTQFKDKYSEYGFATFLEFRGLPVLQKDIMRVRELEDIIQDDKKIKTPEERKQAYIKLKMIFKETEQEVIKDFGQEFVYGKNTNNGLK